MFAVIVSVLFSTAIASAEEKDSQPADSAGVYLQLRSVLVDAEWALFSGGISGSVDIDGSHSSSLFGWPAIRH